MGLLLDIVRYYAIEAQAEKAVKAAASSVLSAYDRTLRNEYSLFGLAATEQERMDIANRVLTGGGSSLRSEPAPLDRWTSVHPSAQSVQVESVYSLADHRFLRRQIMEEMKVKAPIEFTRNVYSKWKDMAPDIEQASEQVQVSEDAEKLLMRRETLLRQAFDMLESMSPAMNEGHRILSQPRPQPILAEQEDESAVEDEALEPLPNPYVDAFATFARLQASLYQLREKLQQVREVEEQIQTMINQDDQQGDVLGDIYLLGYAYLLDYELGAANPVAMFGAATQAANQEGAGPNDLSFYSAFSAYLSQRRVAETERRGAYDKLEESKREQRNKTAQQVEQVKEVLIEQLCGIDDEQHYTSLSAYFEQYRLFNTEQTDGASDGSPTGALEQSPDDLQKHAISGLTQLSTILRDIRDEAYINEYVLLYFNNRVSSQQNQPMLTNMDAHLLQEQEVEYILYGLPSCSGNRAAAYAELFTVRFAVRTVEALLDVRKAAGSPMLMVLTAAAEGAARAFQDMTKLMRGEAIPVFAKVQALKMGYSDYMRLFMAIHSKEMNKMSRIQALIQLNTGSDLRERPVYMRLSSHTEMTMWMLPYVSTVLMRTDEGEEGSVLTINKEAVMAY